ncbi:MAG TPA: bifunctional ornithine acetyltransferase/N-acetylglutamate synthase, partial [bacterium]|nr:bifunctional ornithine acetyltransferase/N-acetylglutamate synthase [bacterium]
QPERTSVRIGPVLVAERGGAVGNRQTLDEVVRYLGGEDVQVVVDLGLGKGEVTVWTCDLTEGYVKENAGYIS